MAAVLCQAICRLPRLNHAAIRCIVFMAGMPTEEHTVYENLDLMVHPMRVHFNDALLANLWVRIHWC